MNAGSGAAQVVLCTAGPALGCFCSAAGDGVGWVGMQAQAVAAQGLPTRLAHIPGLSDFAACGYV